MWVEIENGAIYVIMKPHETQFFGEWGKSGEGCGEERGGEQGTISIAR